MKRVPPILVVAACCALFGCAQHKETAIARDYSKEVMPVSGDIPLSGDIRTDRGPASEPPPSPTQRTQSTPAFSDQPAEQADAEWERLLRDMDKLTRERASTRWSRTVMGMKEVPKDRENLTRYLASTRDAQTVAEQKQAVRELRESLLLAPSSMTDTRTVARQREVLSELENNLTLADASMKSARTEKERKQVFREMAKATHNTASMLRPLGGTLPRVATRAYLYTGQETPKGYGAYAYVVFNADPQKIENERCLAVCQAFNAYLPTTQSRSVPEKKSQMVTFWPLSGRATADEPDCDRLIANYDREFAAQIAASVRKQGVRGPLLVAWAQPYREIDSQALVLDMSNFSNADLGRAILKWKDRIAMDPTIWEDGWRAVVVKEEIRSAIENIGPRVVTVVATWFSKPKPAP